MMMARGTYFGSGGHLQQISLADDRGTVVGAHFSGGGSDEEWRGQLHAASPLATDTAWRATIRERMRQNKHRVYRDRACIDALEEFLLRVTRERRAAS